MCVCIYIHVYNNSRIISLRINIHIYSEKCPSLSYVLFFSLPFLSFFFICSSSKFLIIVLRANEFADTNTLLPVSRRGTQSKVIIFIRIDSIGINNLLFLRK